MLDAVVFTDFSGTLLDTDLEMDMAHTFVPEPAAPLLHALHSGRLSERDGLTELYRLYRTPAREAYRTWWMSTGAFRPGVAATLSALQYAGIPVHVLSSGLAEWVVPRVGGLVPREQIWCSDGRWASGRCHITFPHACDPTACRHQCGLCKPSLIRQLTPPGAVSVMIGDGATDVAAAHVADVVLARPPLAGMLEASGVFHHRYDDFHDVGHILMGLGLMPARVHA